MESKIRVNVYLSQEAIDLLDKHSKEQNISRSALLQKLTLGLKHNSHTTKVTRQVLVEELGYLFKDIDNLLKGQDEEGEHNSHTTKGEKNMRRIAKEEIAEAFKDSNPY